MQQATNTTMHSPRILISHWRAHDGEAEIKEFIDKITSNPQFSTQTCFFALPYVFLKDITSKQFPHVVFGSSHMNNVAEGSFTQSIAAQLLKDAGAEFVVIGSVEHRGVLGESDDVINKKIVRALAVDLMPILCVGDTLDDINNGKSEEVITKQLKHGLEGVASDDYKKIIILFEAPWVDSAQFRPTTEKLLQSYARYHRILEQVATPEVARNMRVVYTFPSDIDESDIDELDSLLASEDAQGFYSNNHDFFFKLLHMHTNPELTFQKNRSSRDTSAAIADALSLAVADENAQPEPVKEHTGTISPEQSQQNEPESKIEAYYGEYSAEALEAAQVDSDVEVSREPAPGKAIEQIPEAKLPAKEAKLPAKEAKADIPKKTEPAAVAPQVPAPSPQVQSTNESEEEDALAEALVEEGSPESSEAVFVPEQNESISVHEEEPAQTAEVSNPGISLRELDESISLVIELDNALADNRAKLKAINSAFPATRRAFEDLMSKMMKNYDALEADIQNAIRDGNREFFESHADKLEKAREVFEQIAQLNNYLANANQMHSDTEALQLANQKLRTSLENAWEFFNKNRGTIKKQYPEFHFPPTPRQLSQPEVKVSLGINQFLDQPSPLLSKKLQIVKTK